VSPISRDDPTFAQAFDKAARARASRVTTESWSPELARDPALLVPVDVQALVVPPGPDLPCAPLGLRPWEDLAQGTPPPFSPMRNRKPGIYLHWTVPDGLTHGRVQEDGLLELAPLPNRWLVLRVEPGRKRRVRGWVVESERGLQQAHRLQGWRERPLKDHRQGEGSALSPGQLTAVAGGTLGSAAVYDSSEYRFAMYDDLRGYQDRAQPLTYLVVGWYSLAELDPLHHGADAPTFDAIMRRLGWTVDEARLEAARAARAAQIAAIQEAHDLEARPLAVAGVDTRVQVGNEAVDVPATGVAGRVLESAETVEVKVEPWAPQRSIFHGVLYGVSPSATGVDPRPAPSAVTVAVGSTGADSLARLIAEAMGDGRERAERLLTAFSYGIVEALEQTDGVVRLEEELHVRGFVSSPAGYKVEQVRGGDPLETQPEVRDRKEHRREAKREERRAREREAKLEFSNKRYDDALQAFREQIAPDVVTPPADPPRQESVRRGEPRFFHAQDPVLTVRGANRSLRHGFDGRFEPDERLACRLSGDTVQAYGGVIRGAELLENRVEHGGIPPEAEGLLHEAVLEDPFFTDAIAEEAAGGRADRRDAIRNRLRGERQLLLRSQEPESDAPRLLAASLKEGVEPSPVAITVWRQAWIPLYVEWELRLGLDDAVAPERWSLGELDYGPLGSPLQPTRAIVGRSLLDASSALALADQVNRFLATEDALDVAGAGIVSEETEALLRATASAVSYPDVLSATFEYLRERLLGYDTTTGPLVDLGQDPPPPVPTSAPQHLRAGVARLARLRIVDAFGRTVELPASQLAGVLLAEVVRPPAGLPWPAGSILLPPRLAPASRLLLRFLDADDDGREATLDQTNPNSGPVAGWLMPDNVDYALEVFDRDGRPVGQLRHEALTSGVTWEGAPGSPQPLGTAPSQTAGSRHVAAMAAAIVQRDAAERAQLSAPAGRESPLSALLRVMDTTRWTIDPLANTGTEHLATLLGRPVAVVRAALTLEVEGGPPPPELARLSFDVRLGALTRFSDGLLGYFVEDDYYRFFPIHASVVASAPPAGPHAGYLGPAAAPDPADDLTVPHPIQTPYVVADPTVTIHPGQTLRLTLLLEPGSDVHVTSGILPRKSVGLLRDWIAPGLDRIAPSFRAGPVLVDVTAVSLPKPSLLGDDQLWSIRNTPITWQDRQITPPTQEAILPERPPVAQEGYLRARPDERGT
jgi:hypothetical protein